MVQLIISNFSPSEKKKQTVTLRIHLKIEDYVLHMNLSISINVKGYRNLHDESEMEQFLTDPDGTEFHLFIITII